MEKRELVINALNHKPGVVPHQINYTAVYADMVRERMGHEIELDEFFGNSITLAKYKKNKVVSKDREVDLFGLMWDKSGGDGGDIGMPMSPPITDTEINPDGSFRGYKMPKPNIEFARSQAEKLAGDKNGYFRMYGVTFALYERVWGLRGMENALMDFICEPKFMHCLLGQITEHHLEMLDAVLDYDFEALYFGDDWGSQRGLVMGPGIWREFIGPCLKKIVDKAKIKGKFVVLHSCGDNWDIIGDWIDIGIDCYNTVQPEIYDLEKLKSEFGRDITFYGAISNQQFLPYANPTEVKEHCLRIMEILARDGGYILSPTHSITPDIPIENALMIVEAAREFGK